MEHRNCRPPGCPKGGMHDVKRDRPCPVVDFTCKVCGRQWIVSNDDHGWIPKEGR